MYKLTSLIIFLVSILILSGCGGYYTKESYYGAKKSQGWLIPVGDNRLSTYKCESASIRLMPSSFSVQRTSEALLGIPVIPSDEKFRTSNSDDKVRVRFEYRGSRSSCTSQDLSMSIGERRLNPTSSSKYYEIPPEGKIYCEYEFNEFVSKLSEYSVVVSPEVIGCEVPELYLSKVTDSIYNFSPW